MSTYYFTFGSGHHDTRGRSLLGWYTSIDAEDEMAARKIFFGKFGDKFATSYSDPGFQEQIKEYGLRYESFEHLDLCSQVPQDEYVKQKLLSDDIQEEILKLRTLHTYQMDDTYIILQALKTHNQLAAAGATTDGDIVAIARAFAQGKIK